MVYSSGKPMIKALDQGYVLAREHRSRNEPSEWASLFVVVKYKHTLTDGILCFEDCEKRLFHDLFE